MFQQLRRRHAYNGARVASRTVLVFEQSESAIRATIFTAPDSASDPEIVAEGRGATFEQAIAALSPAAPQLPDAAVVCTFQAVAVTVKLPVAPENLGNDDLPELIRWEIEPYLAADADSDPQGAAVAFEALPGDADESGRFDWHACGMPMRARSELREQIRDLDLKLQAIYPLVAFADDWIDVDPAEEQDDLRLLAVARHALGTPVGDGITELCLPPIDPTTRSWKRPRNWVVVAAAGALLGIVSGELGLARREQVVRSDLAEADSALQQQEEARAMEGSGEQDVSQLRDVLKARVEELDRLTEFQDLMERELPTCTTLLPRLLDALVASISDHAVIESIARDDESRVRVVAWSLTEPAAQQLAQRLNRTSLIEEWCCEESSLQAARGRLGLDGYRIVLTLAPRAHPEPPDAKQDVKLAMDEVRRN